MYKHSLAVLAVAAVMTGCSTIENPVDYVTFRNEPLVKQVDHGMTREQVRTLGGPPSSEAEHSLSAVSYTHLDVYKRQPIGPMCSPCVMAIRRSRYWATACIPTTRTTTAALRTFSPRPA